MREKEEEEQDEEEEIERKKETERKSWGGELHPLQEYFFFDSFKMEMIKSHKRTLINRGGKKVL